MVYGPIVVDDTSGKFVVTTLNVAVGAAAKIASDLAAPVPAPAPAPAPAPSGSIVWAPVKNNDWTPATQITLNGNAYFTECSEQPYSLQISQNATSPIVRCEVRNNELWSGAMGGNDTERAELDGAGSAYPKGTEFWFSYQFMVEPGAAQIAGTIKPSNPGFPGGPLAWGAIGQVHGEGQGAAVPMAISIVGEQITIRTQTGAQVETLHGTAIPLVRGQVYHVVGKIKVTGDTSSTLTVWIDGKQVTSVTGQAIGNTVDTANYFKVGIYRGWQGDGYPPLVVYVSNIEHGTASLLARVTSPLPAPTIR